MSLRAPAFEPVRLQVDELLPVGERWRYALLCQQWRTCTRVGHKSSALGRWKAAMKSETIESAARILHYSCDWWHDTSLPIENREAGCGVNAERHVAHIATLPWLAESWQAANPERKR